MEPSDIKKLLNNNLLRWLLLIPVVLACFYLCVMLAVGIFIAAETLCPENQIVSELCTAPYLSFTKEALLLITPALAASLIVFSAYLCAPHHKLQTAITIFLLGSVAAIYYALNSGYWLTFVLTEVSSLMFLIIYYKKSRLTVDS